MKPRISIPMSEVRRMVRPKEQEVKLHSYEIEIVFGSRPLLAHYDHCVFMDIAPGPAHLSN